ncbi:hypothetical protein PBRA_008346 [Plasmodiophora brassicae]|nr:hypothetical protein PBRA_008346 [Plasmodiophora brassicae]
MCLSSAAIIFGVPRLTFSQVEVTEKTFNKFVVPATAFNATLSDNDFLATWDAVPDRFPGLMDETSGWKRCLPIDVARCGIGEGPMQTLLAIAEGETPCNSAVLHMMLTEVVHIANTLLGLPTVITYGTLLGAQRDQSIIPYTQDADACIVANDYRQLAEALWYRGYVLFPRFNMASVCVGLHHPLAKKLFSPLGRVDGHYLGRSPYVDIYTWSYDQTGGPSSDVVFDGRIHMRHDDVFPLAYLNVFNTSFPAPRNAIAFLEKEYGSGWSIPDH